MSRWLAALALLLAAVPSCKRCGVDRAGSADPSRPSGPPVELAPARVELGATGSPRIVLEPKLLEVVRKAAKDDSPEWRAVSRLCDEAAAQPIPSGYQGFDWADAVADLGLCWQATGRTSYADAGVGYLKALLDDRFKVGDAQGGESVVRHDDGYGIRTFGAYSALGCDWFRGAPKLDAALRARALGRLEQWLGWYAEHGYLREHPFANYYWGYLTALSLAGLAFAGESPVADAWLKRARAELATKVLPAFRDRLGGGGWPEGWQYGEYTTLEIAFVAHSFRFAAGVDVPRQMPWLGSVVTHHTHALLPDEHSVYDGGDWGEHPAKPSALALSALAVVLDGVDDARAAEARWLVAHVLPPLTREQVWVRLLAARAGAKERDPRQGAPGSLLLAGQGLSFMRSDWSPSAVWASFQAGPFLTEDHQNKDQGHFELWRGSDGLLVDGGDYEGSATINHNTLLVDDGGRHMNYTPNQGVWGSHVKTTRFGDDARVVVAVGDLADAYTPACVTDGCRERSVEHLARSFVFVRPSLVVIDDRVTLERGDYGVTWAAHVVTQPRVVGDVVSAVVGASRVDVRMLEPRGVELGAVREPNGSGEGPHRTNKPWGPMWRIEAKSPRGARERGFLSVISVDRKDAATPSARRVEGDALRGAVSHLGERDVAVLFAGPSATGRVDLGGRADVVVIVGLEPGQRYRASVETGPSCERSIRLAPDASGVVATSGGFFSFEPERCPKH